eukprot:8588771-Alexandrium_andersonii.AAC.1
MALSAARNLQKFGALLSRGGTVVHGRWLKSLDGMSHLLQGAPSDVHRKTITQSNSHSIE